MKVVFKDTKVGKICNDRTKARRTYGDQPAKKLLMRLQQLKDAVCLSDFSKLPQTDCHELKGNRKGQLGTKIHGGLRIVFEPAHDPPPLKADGGLDWTCVTKVVILEVKDYHHG